MWLNKNQAVTKSRLGALLVRKNLITQAQLEDALVNQVDTGQKLGEILISNGLVSERQLAKALRQQTRVRHVAATLALLVAPFQPFLAHAQKIEDNSTNLDKVELHVSNENFGFGLEPLDDDELSDISAQGIADDYQRRAQNQFRDKDDEDAQKQAVLDTVKKLTGSALPFGEILDADVTIGEFEFDQTRSQVTMLADGAIELAMPTRISEISLANIRPKGETTGPSFGSVSMKNIQFSPGSKMTVRISN